MKERVRLILIGWLLVGACSAVPACAQSCERTYVYTLMQLDGPPPGNYDHQTEGSYTFQYKVKVACAPPGAHTQTCPWCPKIGHPIVPTTGDTYISQTDVRIPGLGGGLTLSRAWNSQWPSAYAAQSVGMFGPNWRSNFEERIFLDNNDHYIRYARGDGSYWAFAFTDWDANGTPFFHVVAPGNVTATLKTGTTWTLTFQNGEQRVFDDINGPHTFVTFQYEPPLRRL